MKRARKTVCEPSEDLRSEYSFDYSKAKKNPYAARLKGRTVAGRTIPRGHPKWAIAAISS